MDNSKSVQLLYKKLLIMRMLLQILLMRKNKFKILTSTLVHVWLPLYMYSCVDHISWKKACSHWQKAKPVRNRFETGFTQTSFEPVTIHFCRVHTGNFAVWNSNQNQSFTQKYHVTATCNSSDYAERMAIGVMLVLQIPGSLAYDCV